MKKINYLVVMLTYFLFSCTENVGSKDTNKNSDVTETIKCPCDSSVTFQKNGKEVTQCFVGKSMIEIEDISDKGTKDTLAISRYIKIDFASKWRVQEGMGVVNEKILNPETAFYCDFKEEEKGFRITFIRNESVKAGENYPLIEKVIGGAVIIGKDTIHSKNISVLIPKEKFKGIIQLDKIMNAVYKGKRDVFTGHMKVEAENLIKYGNLLEQYKAINKFCLKK